MVNICVAYAGRDEIASAIRETVADSGFPTKITAKSLTEHMFIGFPPLDLLVFIPTTSKSVFWWHCQSIQSLKRYTPDVRTRRSSGGNPINMCSVNDFAV
jgi:hypothetical protein